MPTPQERVASAMRFFFEQALPQATGRTFAQLSDPMVHLGRYVRHGGAAVPTSLGQSLTPLFAVRVSAALPVAGGQPNPAGATVADSGPVRHLLWTRHAADAAVDSVEEIQRVLADMDSFSNLFQGAAEGSSSAAAPAPAAPATPATGAAPAGGAPADGAPATAAASPAAQASTRAADWARAIVASRASLGVNLSALTAVPEPLRAVAGDLPGLKQVLEHFFTYTADGTYYRRWAGAGRDAGNAAHLTPEYKRENVREVQLERERIYVYMVVPESLLAGGGDLGQGVFREVVVRLDETGDQARPFTLATVYTARWRRSTAPHEDFVFFLSEEGLGLPVEAAVRNKMSPRLQTLLSRYFAAAESDRSQILLESEIVTDEGEERLHLLAVVDGTPTFPQGVLAATSSGPVVPLAAPPARVTEVAALPQVKKLTTVPVATPMLEQARTMVHYPDLNTRIAAASRGGKGVLVGIIDSGIDGSHPAFAGRLVAYWDQISPAVLAGSSPKGRHVGNNDYKDFWWGRELMGAETTGALDANGHGTHVASIAAGAEVKDGAGNILCPAGLAPEAKIVAVRTIGVAGGDIPLATRYILQKAKELSMPCVINMSFGHNDHGHDAGDSMSIDLFHLIHPAGGSYTPGRILVGAAGNERGTGTHVSRRLNAGPGSWLSLPVRLGSKLPPTPPAGRPPRKNERVVIWVRNPTNVCPLAFPLDLWVYRQANPLASTSLVRLGSNLTPPAFLPGLQMQVEISSMLWDPANGDFRFHIDFTYTAPGNVNMPNDPWVLALRNGSTHALEVHSWITAGWRGGAVFGGTAQADDDAFLVGAPADSPGIVSVASVNSRLTWRPHGAAADVTWGGSLNEISSFSSPGPLRAASVNPAVMYGVTDDIRAVDVTAPGNRLQAAATSHPANPHDPTDVVTRDAASLPRSMMLQGTSMASPVVTGMVANLLALKPNLTVPEVIDRLKRCSAIPASSAFQPAGATPAGSKPWSRDWGYGLVDGRTLDLT